MATLVGGGDMTELGSGAGRGPWLSGVGLGQGLLLTESSLRAGTCAGQSVSVAGGCLADLPHRLLPLTGGMQGMGQGMPTASSTCFPRALRCCLDRAGLWLGRCLSPMEHPWQVSPADRDGLGPDLRYESKVPFNRGLQGCVTLAHACAHTH